MGTSQEREPTMEEILASIRRIISEDGEADAQPAHGAPATPPAVPPLDLTAGEPFVASASDVLELTEQQRVDAPSAAHLRAEAPRPEIISEDTAAVATQQLSQLSAMLVKGYEGSENTLEGLVRDMLRPLLKQWLDAHLPDIVEKMVAREIARITGRVD